MPEGNRYLRLTIFLLAVLFAACIVIQVYIAGMATFIDGTHWSDHKNFVHIIEPVPLAIFVLSFFGRVRGAVRWIGLAMLVLVMAQYATAHLSDKLPYFSAAHPVIALILLWLAVYTVKRAYLIWRRTI
ncbi:DUF6220 domain-containing protein [Paenibacillus sp. BC26]|uniref:DUF6220 domain-containing protein n=1 Tax=Paenibacillus sp. BC26 TaxID=1881032 RepID=UPI0008E5F31F|nr:DUF6220 domain-containing protein [Paenibacillus sp. BC26]SFT19901.1 hypothetical protein SAMN05428962_5101 [Paenibacillus sp. BC26]